MSGGNPNPSPENQFKPGKSGNPSGKTSVQKTQELRNAEAAVALRGKMLEALGSVMANMRPEEILERLEPNALKLIKDAEDRGLGAPVQPITSPDGSMTPSVVEIRGVTPAKNDDTDD